MEQPRWLPLNLALMLRPENWLIVGLMLAIPMLAITYLFVSSKQTSQGN